MAKNKIYFDYAAATPMDPRVLTAMLPYFSKKFYNPSAIYLSGRDARNDLNDARQKVSSLIGAAASEIVFTSGATESNNLAIKGIAAKYPKGEILVSAVEHESVLEPAVNIGAKLIPVNAAGILDINALKKKITKKTVLISVMLVNNELGTIQPISEIAKIINEVRKQRLKENNKLPIYLHSDLAQAPNYVEINMARLGLDLATINGAKIYGPKQSGVLFVKAGVLLDPQIIGGGQEFNLRSGTENIASCVGFAKALEMVTKTRKSEQARVIKIRESFELQIQKNFTKAVVNGSKKHRAPHISSITFPGIDNERLMMELDEKGLQTAVGSACSASSDEPSHVLKAIGLSDKEAQSTMRFSFGASTTARDVSKLLKTLKKLV